MEVFTIQKKAYYHDTDCGGVIYYSNYLKYFEEARTEHLLSKGIDVNELIKRGIFFVVSNVEMKYKSPGRYSDILSVSSQIGKIKSVSVEFLQEVKRGQTILVECKSILVLVNAKLRPTPIPEDIAELLNK